MKAGPLIRARQAVSPEAVARHYDEIDPFYRALWGDHLHHGYWLTGAESPAEAGLALIARVAAAAGISPGTGVCDIGCGYGGTARVLAAEHGATVTGLTVSPTQHRYALEAAGPADNPRYLLRDWLVNALPDAHFDVAIAIESMSHMPDIPRALAEAKRVLKPGGRLVLCVWTASETPRPWEIGWLLRPIADEGRLAGLPTLAEYRGWLAELGMVDVAIEDASERVWRTWSVVARRVAWELRKPSAWRYLVRRGNTERRFPLTVLRILVAYRRGCMRYGIVRAVKPPGGGPQREQHSPGSPGS